MKKKHSRIPQRVMQQPKHKSNKIPILINKRSSTVECDVIYIDPRDANKVKTELETLGFLDKRYKMVAVDKDQGKLIALPLTKQYDQLAQHSYSFSRLVVASGIEKVPLSSSSTAKMKQQNGMHSEKTIG